MIGPTALVQLLIATIPLVSSLPHPAVERRSMLPTQWHHQRDHNVHSLFRRQGSDGSDLPAVGSPGMLRSTRVFSSPQYQYSMIIFSRVHRMDSQMANRSLREDPSAMARCPQRRRRGWHHPQHPQFYLKEWQPKLRQSRCRRTGNLLWYLPVQRQERNLGCTR